MIPSHAQLLSEQKMTLRELAREQGVQTCTVRKWVTRGIEGQLLETIDLDGQRFTSREAFARWLGRLKNFTSYRSRS